MNLALWVIAGGVYLTLTFVVIVALRGNKRDSEALERALTQPQPTLPPYPDLAERIAVLESATKELNRQLSDLEVTVERRHKSLVGFLAQERRSDRQPKGENGENDELREQALAQLAQAMQQPATPQAQPARPGGKPMLRPYGR